MTNSSAPVNATPLPVRRASISHWSAVALAILMPLWAIGLFGRGLWTPDEPREYDIAIGMLRSGELVTPHLAGEPFLEKPPLLYWAQSASMRVLGASSAAARLPNLIWAAVTVLCIGWLARSVVAANRRNEAALIATLSCGTMVLLMQVQIWLATDAPLLPATALALLSAWRIANPTDSRRLLWAVLLGVSLAGAFLAKNGFGLMVPGLAVVTWLAWERRLLREVRQWPWWVALGCFALLVGAWLIALANQPGGREFVRALLWDNLAARLLPVRSYASYDLGHESSHWNFLLLLPVFVIPWTFAMFSAARWSVRSSTATSESRSAVRFCIASVVPACIVLLLSRTARDVYFASTLLGMPVLLALWMTSVDADNKSKQRTLRFTRVAALTLAIVIALIVVAVLVFAGVQPVPIAVAIAASAIILTAVRMHSRAATDEMRTVVASTGVFIASMSVFAAIAFPVIERVQDLAGLVATAEPQLKDSRFVLYCGDETTQATLDYVSELRPSSVCGVEDAQRLLSEHPDQRFLVLSSRARSAERIQKMFPAIDTSHWKHRGRRSMPEADELERLGLKPVASWEVPGGRGYALYGR